MLVRVLQTLQMSIHRRHTRTSTRPKDTRARARTSNISKCPFEAASQHVLSSQGHPCSCKYFKHSKCPFSAALPHVSQPFAQLFLFVSSFSEVPRFLRRVVASSSSSFAPRQTRVAVCRALPCRFSFVSRGRPESSASRGASRSDARFSSRSDDAAAMEASSKSDTRKRAPASRVRFSRRETASLARSLARSSEGAPARDYTITTRDAARARRVCATVPVSSTNSYP